jgi:UDP-3-O-[3-hydroxymyristoyl] glucosamine N-acyltransferase
MPDSRFFEDLGPATLAELASLSGARLADPAGGHHLISHVAPLESADAGSITFLSDPKRLADLAGLKGAACFLKPEHATQAPSGCVLLLTSHPQASWAAAAERLYAPRRHDGSAHIHADCQLEEGVCLSPGVVVGQGATIGRDCRIGANAVLGFALVGDRVSIHAGAVIGEAGFGAAGGPQGVVDLPQLGRVILQDGVTIGANSCVDRGAFGDTTIGENTKIDNLVHVAHNVRLGRNCVAAAFTGISGSTTVGDGVAFGGKAGVADHLTVGAGAQIGAAASVFKDVPAGETWTGFPARPLKRWLRETAWLSRKAGGREPRG